jgi:hypothetical protein
MADAVEPSGLRDYPPGERLGLPIDEEDLTKHLGQEKRSAGR